MTNDICILKLADAEPEIRHAAIIIFVDSFYDSYKSISKDKKH